MDMIKNIKNEGLKVWIYITLLFIVLLIITITVMNLQSKDIMDYLLSSLQTELDGIHTSILLSFIVFSLCEIKRIYT